MDRKSERNDVVRTSDRYSVMDGLVCRCFMQEDSLQLCVVVSNKKVLFLSFGSSLVWLVYLKEKKKKILNKWKSHQGKNAQDSRISACELVSRSTRNGGGRNGVC